MKGRKELTKGVAKQNDVRLTSSLCYLLTFIASLLYFCHGTVHCRVLLSRTSSSARITSRACWVVTKG
jgi:hypothetical protein